MAVLLTRLAAQSRKTISRRTPMSCVKMRKAQQVSRKCDCALELTNSYTVSITQKI
jgi:hypothetical protein